MLTSQERMLMQRTVVAECAHGIVEHLLAIDLENHMAFKPDGSDDELAIRGLSAMSISLLQHLQQSFLTRDVLTRVLLPALWDAAVLISDEWLASPETIGFWQRVERL